MRGKTATKPRGPARKNRWKRKPAPPQLPPMEAPQPPVQPQPQPVAKPRELWTVRSKRNLVRAIFAVKDPVDVGTKLLEGGGDATMGKIYALFLEYLYGKPVQPMEASGTEGEKAFQFVTYAPRPQHPVDRNSEDQVSKEACRQSLTGVAGTARTKVGDVTQEDENEQHA